MALDYGKYRLIFCEKSYNLRVFQDWFYEVMQNFQIYPYKKVKRLYM
jgi:hypothetical protein